MLWEHDTANADELYGLVEIDINQFAVGSKTEKTYSFGQVIAIQQLLCRISFLLCLSVACCPSSHVVETRAQEVN